MSLRMRLIISYAVVIVVCLTIVAAALSVLLRDHRHRLLVTRLEDMSKPVFVQVRAAALGRLSPDEAWANLEEQAQETGTYVFLLDGRGNVMRQASPDGDSAVDAPPQLPAQGLGPGRFKPQRGAYTSAEGQDFFYIAYPLPNFPRPNSTTAPANLVVSIPRGVALALWAEFAKPFLWAGLIALTISIVIAVLLARSVYLPIQRVTNGADQIAEGKYEQEVPVAGPKEVRGLATGFNKMARQVHRSQQMLRDFIADASHELRTPLTSIMGFAHAITDGTARDREAQVRAAAVVEDESKRMMRLVNDLLDLSRLESGQVNMVREEIDMKELLEQSREIFAMRAEKSGLQLRADIASLPSVNGDIDRLEQVFGNLLDNALKHTPAEGEVSIVARQPSPASVEITVTDTGPGIPREQLPHVFERFYQADASKDKAGTGLGLAIAREIVRAHGGDIKVDSVLGQGTQFLVRLPINPTVGDYHTT